MASALFEQLPRKDTQAYTQYIAALRKTGQVAIAEQAFAALLESPDSPVTLQVRSAMT